MALAEDIYTRLANDSNVTTLISTRIHPNRLPQEASLPALTFSQVADNPLNNIGGEASGTNSRYQFDCYGTTYTSTQSVADAIETSLLAASTFKTVRLSRVDGYEPEVEYHRVSIDFSFWQ